MITWAKAVMAIVQLAMLVVTWAREQNLLDAGAQQAIAELLAEQNKDITDALAAGEKAGTDFDNAAANGELFDDGNLRKD